MAFQAIQDQFPNFEFASQQEKKWEKWIFTTLPFF